MKTTTFPALALALTTTLIAAPAVLAQSGGPFSLGWNTLEGAGGASAGDPFALCLTVGQPDASFAAAGGNFTLSGAHVDIGPAARLR